MNQQKNYWWEENRLRVFVLVIMLLFALIEVRLLWMQIINRPDFAKAASANRIRTEIIEPIRGRIYDRHGKLIVENRPSYTLYAYPYSVKRNIETLELLSEILELDITELRKRIAVRGWNTFSPAVVMRDVPFDLLAKLEAIRLDIPGIEVHLEAKRSYPYPESVHILGYVGERTSKKSRSGRLGLIGKRGIEKTYEGWLGGEPGIKYNQVDVTGRVTGVLSDPVPIPVKPGWDAILNIDAELQRYAYDLMGNRTGAVVAMDPTNGQVLALLSVPDYDPSIFAGVLPKEIWAKIQSDTTHPLLNRAVQGQYPPGSTYKMVLLAAGWEEGIIENSFRTTCYGTFRIGRRNFNCWNHAGHGSLDWKESLQRSCDVFFYTVGLELGVKVMEKYSRIFGFGSDTHIDLDGELSGITPSIEYMNRKYGVRKWTRGQLANIAIGQGDVLVTPMQLAVYTGAIATGRIQKPRLVEKLHNPTTGDINHTKESSIPLNLPDATRNKIREAMRLVVNEPGGTAYWLRKHDIVIAGKTGTSENPHGEDHGVFVGFAPFDNPLIAVAVIVEHGEHGSTSAAPVACSLMERYIHDLFPGPRQRRVWRVKKDTTKTDSLRTNEIDMKQIGDSTSHDTTR